MIEVPCHCGKTYRVSPDKAGRKLQCKRCGAVQRIPRQIRTDTDEALFVPFQMPGADEGWGDALTIPEEPPLQIKQPLRRCPSCGTQDEGNVVVCVRCGFDWRTGKRLEDAYEGDERAGQAQSAVSTERGLAGLVSLGWASLSPLGLVVGPYVIGRSLGLERRLREADADDDAFQRLAHVRLTALSGTILWAVLALVGVFVAKSMSGGGQVAEAVECRSRLEAVGRAVRERAGEGSFPPSGMSFGDGLVDLVGRGSGLSAVSLYCPIEGGLYSFGRREQELLTSETNPDYLILWDVEAHRDELGRRGFRALRFDGTLEVFRSRRELEDARGRPSFRQLEVIGEGTRPAAGGGPAKPPAAEEVEKRTQRFLSYAKEWDDDDPELLAFVDEEAFLEEVGVPADQLLPALLKSQSERARAAAALMLVRVRMPAREKVPLVRPLRAEEDPRIRLAAGMILQQGDDPTWVALLVSVSEDGEPAHRKAALRVLGQQASGGKEATRSVLLEAAKVRERTGARGDEAILTLPSEALPHAVALLTDPKVKQEAGAALYSADAEGVDALMAQVRSSDRALRIAVFSVLDRLRRKGNVGLEEYLDLVAAEQLPVVRARAIETLAEEEGPPPKALALWTLEALRKVPGGPLADVGRRILARIGLPDAKPPAAHEQGLDWLIADLREDGDHSAVVAELRAGPRAVDDVLDERLESAWKRIADPATRLQLVGLAAARLTEGSLRVLLGAFADEDPEVRAAAINGVQRSGAPKRAAFRKDVGRVLATRLRAEQALRPREKLLELARGGRYCALNDEDVDQHRCSAPLLKALKRLVSNGDRAALRCLSTHPNPAILPFLVDLMISKQGDSSLRGDLAGVLRVLTRVPSSSADGPTWKRELEKSRARINETLRALAGAERRKLAEELEEAEARLERLRGR